MILIDKSGLMPVALEDEPDRHGVCPMTLAIKGTFSIAPDGSVTPLPAEEQPELAGDVGHDDDEGSSLWYANDVVDWKPRVDVLVNAACHAPRGESLTQCDARLDMPGRRKTLRITGDRWWVEDDEGLWHMTDPEPFTSVPIRWERSFGGLMNPLNPYGRGQSPDPAADPEAPYYPLPNVEDPDNPVRWPEDDPEPAGLGPIAETWEQRERKAGTRDMRWSVFHAPRPPADFDPGFNNAAPDDQQLEALEGWEAFTFRNLRPDTPLFRVALPDIRIRVFYVAAGDTEQTLHEIPVALDTVHFDLVGDQLTLLWRGRCDLEIPSQGDGATDALDFLYVVSETASRPRPDATTYQKPFAEDAEIYQETLALDRMTPEEVEQKELSHAAEQIVKVLTDVGAPAAMIAQVQAADSAAGLQETLQAYQEEHVAQARAFQEELMEKFGLTEDDIKNASSSF